MKNNELHVCISKGNSKMGMIQSVSLPPVITCRPDAPCYKECYVRKLARYRATFRNSLQRNFDILTNAPEMYWREVEGAIMMSRYFRFHVSGDIPNGDYFCHMVDIAKRNAHCQILCFTKQFSIVNAWLDEHEGKLPENLHVIFSGWRGLNMDNPYRLPEAHVAFRDGSTTAREGAHECGGNCATCALVGVGCWTLGKGEQVVFKQH